jgi:hypothetical protein
MTRHASRRSARPLRYAPLAFVVVGIAGLCVTAASSLNLSSTQLGAGTTVVASCQPAGKTIDVKFQNAYSSAIKGFGVQQVTLANVDAACAGQKVSVALTDSADAKLFSGSGTIAGTTFDLTVSPEISAAALAGAAVVIGN